MALAPPTIVNSHGERLAFSFTEGARGRNEVVVMGHGLTSDMDRPWSLGLAQALERDGIASLRFAFSGNGESEGRFVESCITKEVQDLGSVLDALHGSRVTYVGHSMGGAVGLLRAIMDSRIANLVSLAAVTHADEFMRDMFGHLQPGEPILGKAHCPFGAILRDDLLGLGSLAVHAPEVKVQWLVIHGADDEVVPQRHSVDLHAAAGATCRFVSLAGVDHSFSGGGVEQMLEIAMPWLRPRVAWWKK